jgi:hypothetical protein
VVDWQTVRELARAFPGVEESTSYGRSALKVRGEEGALVVRVDPEETELLLETHPEAYFTTPHYAGYPMLFVRFEHVDRVELEARVEDAWLLRAPKRLVDEFLERA